MASSGLNPSVKESSIKGGLTVETGTHVVLHQLFLDGTDGFVFVESDAIIWFT